MGNDNTTNPSLDKQGKTRELPATGFHTNPERINKEGRPKRKTLTELIHAKLDETPGGWEAIVKTAISKALTDKEVLRTLWQYTDGMPKQHTDIDIKSDGKPFSLLGSLTDELSSDNSTKETPKAK